MKLFLRLESEGLYIGRNGELVFSETDAREFETVQEAERFAASHRFQAIVVARIGQATYDLYSRRRLAA